MNASPLAASAKRLAATFKTVRELVDLPNLGSNTLSQAEAALNAAAGSKPALVQGLAQIEAGYQACVQAVNAATASKQEAEQKGQATVAAHIGLPDPTSARLIRLQQELHEAFRGLAASLGPGKGV